MKGYLTVILSYLMNIITRLLQYLIPVKENRILFSSFDGEQYACNPKYISEYLIKEHPGEYEIVWMIKHPEQYQFLLKKKITVVNYSNLKKLRYCLTSKVVIINGGSQFSWMKPKRNQLFINTWHGGGYYKICGLSEERKDKYEKKRFALAAKHTSYFLSTNQCFTDNEIRKDFRYNGEVLNIGFPRNDIFFHYDFLNIHKKVCEYFELSEETKILLYAPTNRYADNKMFIIPDFDKLKKELSKSFGGEWAVLTRMHYYDKNIYNIPSTYDASYRPDSPDMQELLAGCDALISDYSSCIWDYSFTYRPCFLFTPDLREYTQSRGFGINIFEWGFPVCETEEKLHEAIENYDAEEFKHAMIKHHEDLGSFENGNACEKMGKLIFDFCFSD